MTDNELDNLFKNTLTNHEAPVPADMWQRIQGSDDKKRRVVFWWKWYAIAAVFLIAGMAAWWYATPTPATSSNATLYNTKHTTENNLTLNADSNTRQPNAAAIIQPNNTAVQQENTRAFSLFQEHKITAASTVTTKENINGRSAVNMVINERQVVLNSNNSKQAAEEPAENDNHANELHTHVLPGSPAAASNKKDTTAKKDDAVAAGTKNTDKAAVANTKKNKHKNKLPWTLALFAATAYADKQTYDVAKPANLISLAAVPLPSKQPKPSLWSYGAGVHLGIPITTKLALQTGLQFNQTRQKIAYQRQNVSEMFAINGFADTSIYRQITYNAENHNSTYNAVSVPVLASYQTGKYIQFGATAGVIINAYSWYSGKVPDAAYSATLNSKKTYRHNTGAALYAGITVSKKIGGLDIVAEPHAQYSLNSFTKSGVAFKQKINMYGLSMGIKMPLH